MFLVIMHIQWVPPYAFDFSYWTVDNTKKQHDPGVQPEAKAGQD
jgi:hypothetical protein